MNRFVRGGVSCVLALMLTLLCIFPAFAESTDLPHGFQGTVTCGGKAAPSGVKITAKIDNVIAGQVTTTTAGEYGTERGAEYGLGVNSTSSGGHTIEFYISNKYGSVLANETYVFQSGSTTDLNLTSEALPSGGGGGGYSGDEDELPTAEELAEMEPADAAAILEDLDMDDILTLIELIESIGADIAADILENLDEDLAAAVLDAITKGKAAAILEEMDADTAAALFNLLDIDDFMEVIDQLDDDTLADILEDLDTGIAAEIVDNLSIPDAADAIGDIGGESGADILDELDPEKAADILDELSDDKVNELIGNMDEDALLDILPELDPDTLYDIDLDTLLDALPNIYADNFIPEVPPESMEGLENPVQLYVTEDGARYLAVQSKAGGWVILVGSPLPVDKLKIKVGDDIADIETEVMRIDEPNEASLLPSGEIVNCFFTINLDNITEEQVLVGHIRIKVSQDWIETNNINKWAVYLNRFDTEAIEWVKLPTIKIEEDNDYVYYDAVINDFSMFAITGGDELAESCFKVSNLTLSSTDVLQDEPVTITADVENVQGTATRYVAALWINHTIEDMRYLTLEKGESATISFDVSKSETGTYMVRMDRQFAEFNVSEEEVVSPVEPGEVIEPEPTEPEPEQEQEPPPEPEPFPWWWIVVAVVVIAVLVFVWKKTRQ